MTRYTQVRLVVPGVKLDFFGFKFELRLWTFQMRQNLCSISRMCFSSDQDRDLTECRRLVCRFFLHDHNNAALPGFMELCQAGGGGGKSGCHAGVKKADWTKPGWYVPSVDCLLVNRHQNGNLCWHLCYHTGEHAAGKGSESFLSSSVERWRGRFVIGVLTGLVVPVRSRFSHCRLLPISS